MGKIRKKLLYLCTLLYLIFPSVALASDKETISVTTYMDDFSSNCVDFSPVMKIIGIILLIVKVIIPLIIIVITSINMANVVSSGKSDEFNKVVKKTTISLIAAVLIFFSADIISVTSNIVTDIIKKPNEYSDIQDCKQCLFHPLSDDCSTFIEISKAKSFGKQEEITITKTTGSGLGGGESSTHTHESGTVFGGHGGKFYPSKPYNGIGRLLKEGQGLWIAHQKNTIEKINDAINQGFYGVEVDVTYSHAEKDFILYHANTKNNGAKLSDFLDIAKENKILAVLDVKTINNKYSELVSMVKKHYSMDSVVFMAFEEAKINGIYNVDPSARLWIINGSSTDAPYNKFDESKMTDDLVEKLEGVAVMATLVDQNVVFWAHKHYLTVEAFSYLDYMYDNVSVSKLREWGVDYVSAGDIDED